MRWMDTLENRPWRLRAPFFSLVLLCLPACQGDDVTATEPLPTGEIARIEIAPKAVLLTEDIDSKELRIRAYDATGREVRADGLDLEWVDADPGDIALVPGDDNTASVSAIAEAGSGIIVARSKTRTDLLSNPVVVRAAVLHDEVVALNDKDIVFPPPDQPIGTSMLDLPGFGLNADGKISVGEFELAELLLSLTTSGAENPQFDNNGAMLKDPAARLRYPVVIARDAYVPGMTRIVGAETSPVAGNVLQAVERGDWVGLMVEAASPVEIYEKLDVEFDGPALDERGLLNLESLIPSSPPPGPGFRGGLTPGPLKPYNEGDCVTGNVSGWSGQIGGITIVPIKTLKPRGVLKISLLNGLEHIMWHVGVDAEASFRPEFNAQVTGTFEAKCYFTDEVAFPLGLSAVTASILDVRWKSRPRIDLKLEVGGGPRFNAYALALCKLKMNHGFEWKKGEGAKLGDEDGDYNKFEVDCPPPEYDVTVSSAYKPDDFGGVSRSDGGEDGFFNLEAGLTMENRFSLLLGGVIMDRLMAMVKSGQETQQVIEQLKARFDGAFAATFDSPPLPLYWRQKLEQAIELTEFGEKMIQGIVDLADVDFLNIEFGPNLKLRLEGTLKILNEADAGTHFADTHQVAGLQFPVKIEIGFLDLGKLFKAIFPLNPEMHVVPAFTIAPPPLDVVSLYTGIHHSGDITSLIVKAPDNDGDEFEVHDTLKVRVPGAFVKSLYDLSGDSKYPSGGSIFIRNSLTDGGKRGVRKVGQLEYIGPEGDTLIFEGEVIVDDNEVRDHLIARKELYFISYNKLGEMSMPGYLNSYTGYDAIPIKVDADVKPPVIIGKTEVGKTIKPVVKLTNKSMNGHKPIDVQVEFGPLPDWITPSAQTSTLTADGELTLPLSLTCKSLGPKAATVPLTLKHVYERPMQKPKEFKEEKKIEVQLLCKKPNKPGNETDPPAFVGTECPADGNLVDYAALDAELPMYENRDQLQFGLKIFPAKGNTCYPITTYELPVPCGEGKFVDYQIWKMGGSVSFNDLDFPIPFIYPDFVWNPHYIAEGMWEEYGFADAQPMTLLSYANENSPLVPCSDARMDVVSAPTSPLIEGSDHKYMIRAYPMHTRMMPDQSWPVGYQNCYDELKMIAGNGMVACGETTSSGTLYMVIQPKLVVGSH